MEIIEIMYFIGYSVCFLSLLNIFVLLYFGYRKQKHHMQQHKGEHVLLITAHPDDESMYFFLINFAKIKGFLDQQ